jgi:hypothetical protein
MTDAGPTGTCFLHGSWFDGSRICPTCKKIEERPKVYRNDVICQNCDNLNMFGRDGCLKKKEKEFDDIPETKNFCRAKEIHNCDSDTATCPYCGASNHVSEIYEYNDDDTEEMVCGDCEKLFKISISVQISYDVYSYAMKRE